MDPTRLLESDHRMVEELFRKIEEADGEERTPLLDELERSLHAHMELEEQVLYPRMATALGEEVLEEADTEHRLARKALQELMDLAPDQPGFGAAMDACRAGIVHHVEEEETQIFPELREKSSILGEMAEPFMARRTELGLPMDATALEASATKAELLADAEAAGLDLRSSMTKHDVAEALADQLVAGST